MHSCECSIPLIYSNEQQVFLPVFLPVTLQLLKCASQTANVAIVDHNMYVRPIVATKNRCPRKNFVSVAPVRHRDDPFGFFLVRDFGAGPYVLLCSRGDYFTASRWFVKGFEKLVCAFFFLASSPALASLSFLRTTAVFLAAERDFTTPRALCQGSFWTKFKTRFYSFFQVRCCQTIYVSQATRQDFTAGTMLCQGHF
jgi:hypothetical protein